MPVLELARQKFERDIHWSEADGRMFFGKEHIMFLTKQEVILSPLRRQDRNTVFPPVSDNSTFVPDDLLKTLTPIITIRRPLRMIDSLWRVTHELTKMVSGDEDFDLQGTLKWTKSMYDCFKARLGIEPVVLDSEDFICNIKALTEKLCAMWSLDPEGVKDTWDPVPKEYWPKQRITTEFIGHMLASKGIERSEKVSKSSNVSTKLY